MSDSLVVYHKGCMDGVAAAWCFWRERTGHDFLPGVYQQDLDLTLFKDKYIFLVDFSYPLAQMREILSVCKLVTILDHHKSCFEMLDELGDHPKVHSYSCTYTKSGCGIAWEYLNRGEEMPMVLQHIQDRDLWKFELEHTREVNAGLFSLDYTDFSVFDKAIQDIDYLRAVGDILEKDRNSRTKKTAGGATEYSGIWNGVRGRMWSVNAPRDLVSDVGNLLCKIPTSGGDLPVYVDCWNVNKGVLEHNLRSLGSFDVSLVAKNRGGGGHLNAAGFKEKFDG